MIDRNKCQEHIKENIRRYKKLNSLNNLKIKNLKPKEKNYKVFDGGGLYIMVTPSGSKFWKLKYKYIYKEKKLSLGQYPIVSIEQARWRRNDAWRILNDGFDPASTYAIEKQKILTKQRISLNLLKIKKEKRKYLITMAELLIDEHNVSKREEYISFFKEELYKFWNI